MSLLRIFLLLYFTGFYISAQNSHHVFPIEVISNASKLAADGSLERPWDLQTALNHPETIKPGDTIYLHGGVYNGRYISKLKGAEDKRITVTAYNSEAVTLNGNVKSDQKGVLIVKAPFVDFVDFEITWLGNFSRDENDTDFESCPGLVHLSGVDCGFYNLRIHDNPGLGIGFWKHGGASIVENCLIYNNGFISKDGKGRGEGIYVQNLSDKVKYIRNNIIYNNYYKGIEVWSAGKRRDYEFVKNITLKGNIIFNSGSPSPRYVDNVIVASADRNGINVAKNIILKDNILYHNTDNGNGKLIGDAASLTIGFNINAPVKNVTVEDNIIMGGYNGIRFLYANSLSFKNNIIYSGNIQVGPAIKDYYKNWEFENNIYYSHRKKPIRIPRVKDYNLGTWKSEFNLDRGSKVRPFSKLELDQVVRIAEHRLNRNMFNIVLFTEEFNPVELHISEIGNHLKIGQTYNIIDVENPDVILKNGQISDTGMIEVPMDSKAFKKPLHNDRAVKTLRNLGVFQIEFFDKSTSETIKTRSAFERFFEWLGLFESR